MAAQRATHRIHRQLQVDGKVWRAAACQPTQRMAAWLQAARLRCLGAIALHVPTNEVGVNGAMPFATHPCDFAVASMGNMAGRVVCEEPVHHRLFTKSHGLLSKLLLTSSNLPARMPKRRPHLGRRPPCPQKAACPHQPLQRAQKAGWQGSDRCYACSVPGS